MGVYDKMNLFLLFMFFVAGFLIGTVFTVIFYHPLFGYSPYCEYDEAYCLTGKPDPDLTQREIQYYCMLLDDSDRPPFCFKETLDFNYRMTPYLKEETRILALCFDSNLTVEKCNMMSGKVNSSYGDKLN